MTAFARQCWQVWLDWFRWPPCRLLLWTIVFYWILLGDYYYYDVGGTLNNIYLLNKLWAWIVILVKVIPIILLAAVPLMVVWRVRTQMRDWRATVIPHYRLPHLGVSAFIVLAIIFVMGVLPTVVDLILVHQRVPVGSYYGSWIIWIRLAELAQALCLAIAAAWLVAWLSPMLALSLILFGAILASLGSMGINGLSLFFDWHPLPPAILMLCVIDAVFSIWLWISLGRMSNPGQGLAADERMPWLSNLLVKLDAAPEGEIFHANLWQRARHRRSIGLGHRFIWLVAVYMAGIVVLSPLLDSSTRWLDNLGYAFCALGVAGVISTLAIGLSWPLRLESLGEIELLRPATRAGFAREIGVAMLADTVEISLATLLLMLAPIFYWSPASLSKLLFWQGAAAMLLSQVLVYGTLALSLRRPSHQSAIIVATLNMAVTALLIESALSGRTLLPSLLAAGIGILLSACAYRQWLRADVI